MKPLRIYRELGLQAYIHHSTTGHVVTGNDHNPAGRKTLDVHDFGFSCTSCPTTWTRPYREMLAAFDEICGPDTATRRAQGQVDMDFSRDIVAGKWEKHFSKADLSKADLSKVLTPEQTDKAINALRFLVSCHGCVWGMSRQGTGGCAIESGHDVDCHVCQAEALLKELGIEVR